MDNKIGNKIGVIETIADLIKALQKCNPSAKVGVRGGLVTIDAVDKNHICLDINENKRN